VRAKKEVNSLCNYRFGRICLHVAAMTLDRQFKWHLAGIRRELALRPANAAPHGRSRIWIAKHLTVRGGNFARTATGTRPNRGAAERKDDKLRVLLKN
jgi:hypothetical protein